MAATSSGCVRTRLCLAFTFGLSHSNPNCFGIGACSSCESIDALRNSSGRLASPTTFELLILLN
jgi:hypothetical protein